MDNNSELIRIDKTAGMQSAASGTTNAYAENIKAALRDLINQPEFLKARRMSSLLCFLVDKTLAGTPRETSEYAIGVGAFQRNPATYSPGEDPIVRIQMSRLRERLRAYYAGPGANDLVRFSIPPGSYQPQITLHTLPDALPPPAHSLAVVPIEPITDDAATAAFARGLNEELRYRLFKRMGHRIALRAASNDAGARLEGSIRIDHGRIRTTLRVVDNDAGCIKWAGQFDRPAPGAIDVQEELAIAICTALEACFIRPA